MPPRPPPRGYERVIGLDANLPGREHGRRSVLEYRRLRRDVITSVRPEVDRFKAAFTRAAEQTKDTIENLEAEMQNRDKSRPDIAEREPGYVPLEGTPDFGKPTARRYSKAWCLGILPWNPVYGYSASFAYKELLVGDEGGPAEEVGFDHLLLNGYSKESFRAFGNRPRYGTERFSMMHQVRFMGTQFDGFTFMSTTMDPEMPKQSSANDAVVFPHGPSHESTHVMRVGTSLPSRHLTYVPEIRAPEVSQLTEFAMSQTPFLGTRRPFLTRRCMLRGDNQIGRRGARVTGKYIDVGGVLISASYLYARHTGNPSTDVATIRNPVSAGYAQGLASSIAGLFPGTSDARDVASSLGRVDLFTVHRVIAVRSVDAIAAHRSVCALLTGHGASHCVFGTLDADLVATVQADRPVIDIFAPLDAGALDDMEVLYDKMYETSTIEPQQRVRINIPTAEEYAFDGDTPIGNHVCLIYISYVPSLPATPPHIFVHRKSDRRPALVGEVVGMPAAHLDTGVQGFTCCEEEPFLPNLVPGRFRFTSTFTFNDK